MCRDICFIVDSNKRVQKIIYEIKDTLYYSKMQLIFILIKRVTHQDRVVVNMTCSVSVTNQVNVRQCLYSACALTALLLYRI
jgi:hypothetical protein